MSKKGQRAGVPVLQYPVSTSQAIGSLSAVVPTVSAVTPSKLGLNGVEAQLPAGTYKVLVGMVGEDPVAGGYCVGVTTVAEPTAGQAITLGQALQVQIASSDRPANSTGCPAVAAFLLEPGATQAQYAGMFAIPPSGEINFAITTLPLLSLSFFDISVLNSSGLDPNGILGASRAPTQYTFLTLGPTDSGVDVGRPVAAINFTPDNSADSRIPTVRSTLIGFEVLPNQMEQIALAAGGDFAQITNSSSKKVQQCRLSPSVVTAIFPGNRPFRLVMPLNSDGSQEVRTYMAKIIRNVDEITERWRKTEQTGIQFRLADVNNDYLLDGVPTELHYAQMNT